MISKNEKEIKQMFVGGATLQEIGKVFDTSRQRIHQIVRARRDIREWHEQRRRTNLELIGQYNCTPVCQRCRNFLTSRDGYRNRGLCRDCRKKASLVLAAQGYIRKKGEIITKRGFGCHRNLSRAAYLIRKHNLKPADFR